MKEKDEFDRAFDKMERVIYLVWTIATLIAVSLLGLFFWAITKIVPLVGEFLQLLIESLGA